MRRFFIGAVVGGLLMYAWIHYGPVWSQGGSAWMNDAASGYRGDRHQQRAREILQ